MTGDPSRRPSSDRIRVGGDINALVWIECTTCLGDGWHYPMTAMMVDRTRKNRKITCRVCAGLGARQIPALQCTPDAKIVAAPARHSSPAGGP